MDFVPLDLSDLFDQNGNVSVFCCRRDGGDCIMPFRLLGTNIPKDEWQRVLDAVNAGGWAKDGAGKPYCPACTQALGKSQ